MIHRRDFLGIFSLLPFVGKVLPALAADIQVEVEAPLHHPLAQRGPWVRFVDFPGMVTVKVSRGEKQYLFYAFFEDVEIASRFEKRVLNHPRKYAKMFSGDDLTLVVDGLTFRLRHIVAGA